MATTTAATLIQQVAEEFGDYRALTCTSAGNAGGTTLVSTHFGDWTEGDNGFPGWWIKITSGTNDGEIRRVLGTGGYTASSNTVTVGRAFTAQVADAVTFELYEYRPADYLDATNAAVRRLHPSLYLHVIDESIIVDNLLSYSGFDGTPPTGTVTDPYRWTHTNMNSAAETTIVWHGSQSLQVTAVGTDDGRWHQNIFGKVDIEEVAGRTLSVRGRVWCDTANEVFYRVSFDDFSTYAASSSYHTGASRWENLTLTATIPTDATSMYVVGWVESEDQVAYADVVSASIMPLYRYTLPTTCVTGPNFVSQQFDASNPRGIYRRFKRGFGPKTHRILRLEYEGRLSTVTADTDTVEVDETRAQLIVVRAVQWLAEQRATYAGSKEEIQRFEGIAGRANFQVEELKLQDGVVMPRMSANIPESYQVEEDSNGRYLQFIGEREGVTLEV